MPGYFSEVGYSAGTPQDFIEFAVTVNTDVSSYTVVVYGSDGYVDETLSLGTAVFTIAGKDIYIVDNGTTGFNGIEGSDAIAIIDDLGNVVQFISFGGTVTANDGAASGETSTDIGTTNGNRTLQSDDRGASYYVQNNPNAGTIPCYAPGTLIDTPDGARAVETLRPGNLVETLNHGPLPVVWVERRDQELRQAADDSMPVLIRANAFEPGCPSADLIVSPQHRILVGGAGQLNGLWQGQAFAPAKALTGLPGIRFMTGKQRITWVHFALDTHQVVTANGCFSESLLLGPMALAGMTEMQRSELARFFGDRPSACDSLNGPPARDCLRVGEVRKAVDLLRRYKFAAPRAA